MLPKLGMIELLVLISAVEAIVYHFRYRSAANRSALHAAFWAAMVCSTRLVFTILGVTAVIQKAPLVPVVLAYVVPASLVTFIVHALSHRRVGP